MDVRGASQKHTSQFVYTLPTPYLPTQVSINHGSWLVGQGFAFAVQHYWLYCLYCCELTESGAELQANTSNMHTNIALHATIMAPTVPRPWWRLGLVVGLVESWLGGLYAGV